jgi:hypothetical protein
LLLFPISAIGLNIYVHKCKTSGIISFSFINSATENSKKFKCCCDEAVIKDSKNNTPKVVNHDVSEKSLFKVINSVQIPDKKESKKKNKTLSCCSQSHKAIQTTVNSKKTITNKIHVNESKLPVNSATKPFYNNHSCCLISSASFGLNTQYISLDNSKNIKELSDLNSIVFQKINYCSLVCKQSNFKLFKYPLKEPILTIISFMHFTSNTGDDTDAPILNYC